MFRYLLALCLILAVSAAVPKLTGEGFFHELSTQEFLFVKFYSPNCRHCHAMAEEYERLFERSQGKGYKVAELDCTQSPQLCDQLEVKGYPTLKLYATGTGFTYEGQRTAEAMSAWIQDLQNASLTPLSEEQAKKMIGSETFVIVSGLSKRSQNLIAIATKLHDTGIRYYSYQLRGLIGLYKPGSLQPIRYNTDQHFPLSMVDWAFEQGRIAIAPIAGDTFNYIKRQKKFQYVVGVILEDDEFGKNQVKEFAKWCKKNIKQVLCLHVKKDNQFYAQFKKIGNVKEDKTTVFIAKKDFSIGYHYPYPKATNESIAQFYEDAKADKIERAIDTERDIRERIKYTNVLKLTPQTFRQVLSENEFVFVEFYSPHCYHCVKFAEQYDSVAGYFKGLQSNVVVAALDLSGQENGIMKEEGIQGYPSFRIYVKGKGLKFNRDRSAENIINFINDVTTAHFQQAESLENVPLPYVVVSGVEEDSIMKVISGLFRKLPVYHASSQGEFNVTIHDKKVRQYNGNNDVLEVLDWLQFETAPILSSLGESKPNKKLEKALFDHQPLLIVVNKYEDRSNVQPILDLLTQFCEDKTDYVCGYLHKGEEDYEIIMTWLDDKDTETNRLFWINTQKSLKYDYQGDLPALNIDSLAEFVRAGQAGELTAFGGKNKVTQEEAKEQAKQQVEKVNEEL